VRLALLGLGGFAAASVLWLLGRSMFEAPILQRRNYRDVDVPVGAGILIVVAAIAVEALVRLVDVARDEAHLLETGARGWTLVAASGFGLLGLFDDLAAHGDDRGFRGHLRALAGGRLTTGGLKLGAGGLLALVLAAGRTPHSIGRTLLGGAVIALAANVGNLFDRAPGRTTKVALAAGIAVVAAASSAERPALAGMIVVLAAGAGLLAFDLGERLMLGDAGSNVLGAAVGLGVVLTCGATVQWVVLAVLVALNVASELVSFSRVIDRVSVLRALDRAGRRRA
jgi:UDP-N-acetylmuramyl pentapeptide phosphotransferase/UDP-N-acetylglucosamine-1-phosphate transferase